jgi:cytochrome c-type protein NapC
LLEKCRRKNEVWGTLFGTISIREKFLGKRLELAKHEWTRSKSNDTLECRNCHSEEYMDFSRQSPRAAVVHQKYLVTGEKTCIDCHKGIAHKLPNMSSVEGWN